jgi:hypothetical protein
MWVSAAQGIALLFRYVAGIKVGMLLTAMYLCVASLYRQRCDYGTRWIKIQFETNKQAGKRLSPKVFHKPASSVKSITNLLIYLVTYLLHAAKSFLRS